MCSDAAMAKPVLPGGRRPSANLDKRLPDLKPWTLHDLRRTCATGMAELGTLPHIVELMLNHISGHKGGIAGIYNHAVNGKERREALDQWATHFMQLVGKPKPVAKPAKPIKLVAKAGASASPRPHKAAA
jgi:hypothetical protein